MPDAPVLAKYYAWYTADGWGGGRLSDAPVEPYRSADPRTIERQVVQARDAGIDGFVVNWEGPNSTIDANLRTLLAVAGPRGLKVSVDVDMNALARGGPERTAAALQYLRRYFADPAWVRYEGRPLVSFFGIRKLPVEVWASIRQAADPGQEALWLGEGDLFEYLEVFDGIHPYSVAWSPNPSAQLASYAARTRSRPGKLWVATVMPGYDDTRLGRPDGFATDRRGGAYYAELWRGAIATRPAFVMITSWNEWMEGTQIEPSRSYGDLYLRLTREMADAFRGGLAPPPARPAAPPTADGAFYTEAGGGRGGFAIADRDGIGFWSSFRTLGGVDALGYPASRPFRRDGFTYQATQGAVLQWRPELGRAVLANAFEWFTDAGKDGWLLETAGIPPPIRDDGSNGDWERAKRARLGWLEDEAIGRHYLAAGSLERAIELYGLPTSRPERRGPFVVQRFQRIAFQRWVERVPGMPPPGSVVRVLGGDLLKQAGLIPSEAAQPVPP
jgi:hypothetical protein